MNSATKAAQVTLDRVTQTHLRHIFDKLAIDNRSQLVAVVANRNR